MAPLPPVPAKRYVEWTPNNSFVKFFEDLSKRRIAGTDNTVRRVTDTSPPDNTHIAKKQSNTKIKKRKPDKINERVAKSSAGASYKRPSSASTAVKRKRKRAGVEKNRDRDVEKRIKNFKF